jgi:Cu(I)/Ag(I) efflux system membrane protein CusA/SilA
MIAWTIEQSVRHRSLVVIVTVLLSLAGVWAASETPVDAIPDLSDIQVIVLSEYPGQAPQVVEDQVTYPLTTALLSVPHARTVRGYSFFGHSMVYVIFDDGTDLYWARSRVLELLNFARDRLPEGVSPRLGPDATGVGWVFQYTLRDFGPRARALRAILDSDGDGVVAANELPAPGALDERGEGAFSDAQLIRLLGGDAMALGFLLDGFDRDRNRQISPAELALAANFRGLDLAQLRSIQDWYLRYDLTSVEGVAEVASVGGFVRQYQVEVDPEKLRAFGVTLSRVKQAIQRSNQDVGGRLLEMGETEFMVRARGTLASVADLELVPVGVDMVSHTPVLLRQVANVHLGPELRRGLVEMDGQGEVVSGIVVMRFGENALEVIERVKQRLIELKPGLPAGVEIHISYDRSSLIERAIATLRSKLLEEMAVVALVCILFLLHFRSALVAVLTLPAGILAAFAAMRLFGVNANIMSLGGIAIAIGVMVDASVVMVENLHKHKERHPELGHTEAVVRSAREVGPALFFSLLMITVSFVPVFGLGQQSGRLFVPLALTKTFAMAASALLAITLIPALLVIFVRGPVRSERANPVSRFCVWIYRPFVRWVLRAPRLTVAIAVAVTGLTVAPWVNLGSELMPPLNEGDLLYMPTTPPGISITKARELLQQTDRIIASHPQVAHVLGKAGRAETATDPAPLSMLETIIILTDAETWPPGTTIEGIARELDSMVQLPGLTNSWTMPIRTRIDMLATGIRTPVGIKLLGDDLAELGRVGERIEAVLRGLEGTRSVYSERVTGGSFVDIDVDREAAARFGLTAADVQDVVASAIGGRNVTWTVEGLERYPVNVRYPRDLRDSPEQLRRVAVPTPMGHTIPLASVAEVTVSRGPPSIKSENARRTAWIFVDLDTTDIGGYVARARKMVAREVPMPDGVAIAWSGQYELMRAARERLWKLGLMTLAAVFLLLYLHFRRVTESVLVMLALPFALVGGVWLVWAAGYNLSVAVGVGFIALAGLAAETGVVMLVYLDEARARYRREGRLQGVDDLRDAILEGAADRLRPKLMTVATTTLGLLPIMLGDGTGTRVMKRIAAPMVGGLVSSAVLTLVVLPAVYFLWRRRSLPPEA